MDLSSLKNTPGARKTRKRVGRGAGSGLGKTSGKGQKGQQSRKGHKGKLGFEGGQMPLIRRLPKRGFKNPNRLNFLAVNVCTLDKFDEGTEVTLDFLREQGMLGAKFDGVKVLGKGELTKKLTVKVNGVSASAKAKIEAAGGTVLPLRDGPSFQEKRKAAGLAARKAAKASAKAKA
ncbi:MAG: 50S ribosomal protein L15 [Kiritimatiellae bacterium]|nr:50S ribosomal protein L15 [Kiritimatiellia bacterium]